MKDQPSASTSWALQLSLLWPQDGTESLAALAIPDLGEWGGGGGWVEAAHSRRATGSFCLCPHSCGGFLKIRFLPPPFSGASPDSLHSGVSL